MKKIVFGGCLLLVGLFVATSFYLPSKYVVPVIVYHSVALFSDEPLNNVQPKNFLKQMSFIKNRGYRVITALEWVEGLRAGKAFDRNTVVIIFDDGYKDNYFNAFPILQKCGFLATIFLAPDYMERPGRLTWDQIREMADYGIQIGSHVMGERYVPDLQRDELVAALRDSKQLIERNVGRPVDLLAYPVGGYTKEAQEIARRVGYKAAFTTNRGENSANDLYALRRIRIKDSDGFLQMWVKLSGYYDLFRSSRKSH